MRIDIAARPTIAPTIHRGIRACMSFYIHEMITYSVPTPAPPNKPILPPRLYGANASTTLIPVSNITQLVSKSTNAGPAR